MEQNLQPIPWRRYFARGLDGTIYGAIFALILIFCLDVNYGSRNSGWNIVDAIVTAIMMVTIEPLLLKYWGTTPGKWLLGLSVRDKGGNKLSYSQGVDRTWGTIWRGQGAYIPIYSWVRLWKSYCACKDGEELDWEADSVVHIKDRKKWRIAAYILASVAVLGVLICAILCKEYPPNRGDLTVAEFAENYNYASKYFKIDASFTGGDTLDENGKRVEVDSNAFAIYLTDTDPVDYDYTVENGVVTEVSFTSEGMCDFFGVPDFRSDMLLLYLALGRAQPQWSPLDTQSNQAVIDKLNQKNESWTATAQGITMIYEVDCDTPQGHYDGDPSAVTDIPYTIYFSIKVK